MAAMATEPEQDERLVAAIDFLKRNGRRPWRAFAVDADSIAYVDIRREPRTLWLFPDGKVRDVAGWDV